MTGFSTPVFRRARTVAKGFVVAALAAIAFAALTPGQAAAQRCNLDLDQRDPVTGAILKRTLDTIMGKLNGQPFYFKAQRIGDKRYLKMRYYRYGDFEISDSQPLQLVLLDGRQIGITPRDMPASQNEGSVTAVSSMLLFELPADVVKSLTSVPVRAIMFRTADGGDGAVEIRERFRGVIGLLLNCIG